MNNMIKSGYPRNLCRFVLAILFMGMSQFEAGAVSSRFKQIGHLDVGSEKIMPLKKSAVSKAAARSGSGIADTLMCNEISEDSYTEYTGTYSNTPSDFSSGSTVSTVASPVFRPESCSFTTPISVEILAEEGCDVYYRTDGYSPTVDEQYKYNGPIVISATTTFQAIAADSNGNTSRIVTSKYTCTRHGIGEGYDPASPGNPGTESGETQEKTYKLTVVTNPSGAGSAYANSYNLKVGAQTRVYTYNNTGFEFLNWTIEGEEVSKSSSFYYVMPEYDVTIVANYSYNPQSPGNPSPEEQKVKHPVVVRAIPSGAASLSPSGTFDMEENASRQIYAYPNSGWHLTGWTINGETLQATTSPINITMGEKALDIVAYFTYNPSSPSNPGANYYNPTTGQVIIDDFTPGYLYDALSNLVGYSNFSNISSLIVKGEVTSNDLGNLSYFSNAGSIDISRTGGVSTLPGYTFSSVGASSIVLPSTISSLGNYVFRYCENLASLTIYAQEPPTCNSYTFSGFTNKANCTVYVPASAIELYSNADYWKDFTILPITSDAHVLQVNLPADASDGRYKNNSIEIVNINSGVRQKYVITDRLLYTFNGLQKDEQYNIYMFSQAGLEIGRIENVTIPDQDIEVTFDNLKELYTVFAKVTTPDGKDVTLDVTVEWLKPLADGTTTYLRKATSLGEIPEGQVLLCRVTLNNQLGTVYAMPEDTEFTVSNEQNTCMVNLVPFRSIALSGTVVDGDGAALSGASVSVNQTLNGKYSKSYTAKTDRQGKWSLSVLDAPETRLTYAASECVNVNDTIGAFESEVTTLDLGRTTLKSIVGARVTYGFTYHAAGSEDIQDYYSDYQNVLVSVFNVTQNRAHNDVSLQYPILAVLDENINTGDELRLTATSKTGAFNPIVETVVVGENQRAEVTFDIIGKGGIAAAFEMTDNPAVIAMLYSSKGELLKKQTYSEAQTTFTELEDGDYTLVSMGQSDLMNSILRLSNFSEIGLAEGKDYVKNIVKVESGKLSEVKNTEIPAFDESLFYYTNSSTSFSSNKSSITTGNYLTLRAAIDFKGVYKNDISNVALVVDLPEACDFVEQSVIQGPNLLPYTIDNNRLTIQLGNTYTAQTRFCVIPTNGGKFNATASIVFDYNGKTLTQPIGSAPSEIKDIEITVPSVVAGSKFKVSGIALGNSNVNIFEDGAILGSDKANAAGSWNVDCNLSNPYNLSTHKIYAEITTPTGTTMTTETKTLTYDINALQVSKVTMYHWNPEMHKTYVSEFDFLNPKTSATQWTVYYPKKIFTYTIEFTSNDPERISNVILYVHTADGKFVPVNASFDEQKGMWYAEIDMGTSSDGYYPVNCSVDFDYEAQIAIDRNLHNETIERIDKERDKLENVKAEIDNLEKEAKEILDQLQIDAPIITTTISNLSQEQDTDKDFIHLQNLYSFFGWEFKDSNLTVSTEVDESQEFIDSLMNGVEESLAESDNDLENFDNEFNLLIKSSDLLLKEIDDATAIADSSLDNFDEKAFVIETAIGDYNYSEINASSVDRSNLDDQYVTPIAMSDGSELIFYYDETNIVIIDEANDKAWLINSAQAPGLRAKRRISSDEIVQKLHEAFNALNSAKTLISNMISDWSNGIKEECKKLTSQMDDLEAKWMDELTESTKTQQKIEKLERQLQEMGKQVKNGTSANYMGEAVDFNAKIKQLKDKREQLLRKAELHNKHISNYKSKINGFKAKIAVKTALLGEIMDYWEIVTGIVRLTDIVQYGIRDMSAWSSLIGYILPCEDDYSAAQSLKKEAEDYRGKWGRGYCGAGTLSFASTGLSGYCAFNTAAKFVMKTVGALVSDFIKNTAISIYEDTKNNSRTTFNQIKQKRAKLKCKKNCGEDGMPPCPEPPSNGSGSNNPGQDSNGGNKPGGGAHQSGSPSDGVQIDPSGFVYEAVPENRIEGVQTTIYYKETKEDMYGDPYEDIVLWNAEEYAQQNPLFTDEFGMYRWDVPQGLWQVKFEKDGYVTAYSEWLPVPPPQLEVNIGIVQNKQPEVTEARAYEEGVEVQFDKFMDLSTLTTDNIYVTANGEKLNGSIRLIDSALADEYADEEDSDALRYASRVRFVPEETLSATTGEIRVTVSRNVLSYAGIPMTETFSQVLDVEKEVQAITADDVKVLYGGEKEVTVYALPYEAAVGRTLRIANSSELITSVDKTEATIDGEGKATVIVKGDLPGRAQLTFSIDDVTATGECAVDVVTEIVNAEAPKSSRASGTAVYRGTKVELTTESKDGVIYFTTDGSCPCDENGTRRKYTVPIIINEDTKILAMTTVGTGDDDVSEIVEFNYTLKRSDMDFAMDEGWTWISHNFETPIAAGTLAADENVQRIMSQTQEVIRDPQLGMVGMLQELNASESYKVETTSATARQRLSEIAWNPATPIALNSGWNWLGYPVSQTMSVDEAFAPTVAENLDVIVGQNGFAQFDGESWIGTLEILSPGLGYMYQSQSPKNVVYNTSIVSTASARYVAGISQNSPLVLDIHKYPSIMPVVATIKNVDGMNLDNEDYQVNAFCGTECRGIGRVVNGLVMMNVYGNTNDKITFQVTDNDGAVQFVNNSSLSFSEQIIGNLNEPYTISINIQSGISDVTYDGNIKVCIVGDMLVIKGIAADDIDLVEVYDIDGQKLIHETKVNESGIRISNLNTGVYIVIVNGNGEYTYHKIALR